MTFTFVRMNNYLIALIVFGLIGLTGAAYVFVSWRSHRTPGRPFSHTDCVSGGVPNAGKRVVVFGDSLTHGTMSHNWLVDLQGKHGDDFTFINQGWNGDLAWNAYQKLDQVAQCDPDIVAVFIGGNDALAAFSPVWTENFVRNKGLPQTPSADWYRQNLELIVSDLQAKTDAELVLFTLTMFGEDLDSPENKRFRAYSQIVEETGAKFGIDVLPIHQNMRAFVATSQKENKVDKSCSPADWDGYRRQIKWAIIRYHFFFQSWDVISASRGYVAQTDCAHLNSSAAEIIANMFSDWLDQR